MKNLNKLLIIIILLFSSTIYCATTIACKGGNSHLNDMIMDKVLEDYEKVEFVSLKVNQVTKALSENCDTFSLNFPKFIPLNSDLVIKVDSYEDNNFINRKTQIFRFEGDAKVYKTAKVINDKDSFTDYNIYESSIKVRNLSNRMVGNKNAFEGYQFRNYVDKDQIIENWMVEKVPDIAKGNSVTAIFSKSNIRLTLDAKVLENGNIGESIKVKLEKNKKVMLGKVYDKETVIISSR